MKYVALPSRGEFGLRIRYHVPAVKALDTPKVVYHERGEEALYPDATRLVELPRIDDNDRVGTHPTSDAEFVERYRRFASQRWPDAEPIVTNPSMPQERFIPEPVETHGLDPDIVVCPRWREYGSAKNWPGWRPLTAELIDRGYEVAAAGAPDSSLNVPCKVKAWEYERFLDASIEMMRAADVVIATDAGLAHLAVLCGADMIVVTHEGRVAPGPVVDSNGTVAHEKYWRAGYGPGGDVDRFKSANHAWARIEYVDGWEGVGKVTQAVEEW